MGRTVSHLEDEETHDISSHTDCKRVYQKANASRSKHSETEQRRRSKINERFQILRDLIPENDQKRDKASFLLEVIQYVQFLQEKLQTYEGSCQGWSSESTKCLPLRIDSGPDVSFDDQAQFESNFYGHEDNVHQTLLRNTLSTVDSDLTGATLYKSTDNPPLTTQALATDMPPQAAVFESLPDHPHQGPFGYWLLNSLKSSLQSSGVDLSQTNISVQLDVGKQTNGGSTNPVTSIKDQENASSGLCYGSPMDVGKNHGHPLKRLRSVQKLVQL